MTRKVLVSQTMPCPREKDLPPAPQPRFPATSPQGAPEHEVAALALDADSWRQDSLALRQAIRNCNEPKE
jgi:hypothetical protein